MTADGEVDWPGVEKHIDDVISAGADGIVVTGTTGETSTLTDPEKIRLVEVGKDVAAGPREDHHGRRLERDRARDRALQALRAGRRRRHHDRHAVLQQADAGRHPHALPARGRRHRPAGHPLRHPGPHRRADQVRDDPRASRSTRTSSRSRTPRATSPRSAACSTRPTCCTSPATTPTCCRTSSIGAIGPHRRHREHRPGALPHDRRCREPRRPRRGHRRAPAARTARARRHDPRARHRRGEVHPARPRPHLAARACGCPSSAPKSGRPPSSKTRSTTCGASRASTSDNFRPDRNAAAGGALPKVAGTTR